MVEHWGAVGPRGVLAILVWLFLQSLKRMICIHWPENKNPYGGRLSPQSKVDEQPLEKQLPEKGFRKDLAQRLPPPAKKLITESKLARPARGRGMKKIAVANGSLPCCHGWCRCCVPPAASIVHLVVSSGSGAVGISNKGGQQWVTLRNCRVGPRERRTAGRGSHHS